MLKITALIATVLLLAACEPTEEEKTNLRAVLPEGCVIHDVGSYGSLEQLLVIVCDGRNVTNTGFYVTRSNGKQTYTDAYATVTIE